MTIEIYSVEKFEKLIDDREYIDNLFISINQDINHLLQHLTHLTDLSFDYGYNQLTDLSSLTNLKCLFFMEYYNQPLDLTSLTNLTYLRYNGLEFDSEYLNILKNKKLIF